MNLKIQKGSFKKFMFFFWNLCCGTKHCNNYRHRFYFMYLLMFFVVILKICLKTLTCDNALIACD